MSVNTELKSKYFIFRELDQELVKKIKYFYINKSNALFATRDDVVYRYYFDNYRKHLKELKNLSFKNVVKFEVSFNRYSNKHIFTHYLALTKGGELYVWGYNKFGQLGINSTNDCEEPVKNVSFGNNCISDACCGEWHTVVLTLNGEVFCFGWNDKGQVGNNNSVFQLTPIKINFNSSEKVSSISCGLSHSIADTKSGSIFGWGSNESGQLGIMVDGNLFEPEIIKIVPYARAVVCGPKFTVILSKENDLYFSGHINGKVLSFKYFTPMNITLKFIDVVTSLQDPICVAMTVTNKLYVLGKYRDEVHNEFKEIKEIDSKSINDVFANNLQITHNTADVDHLYEYQYDKKTEFIIQKIEKELKPNKFKTCYNQLGAIGGGSYGNVYKCVDKQDNTLYAIKKISLGNDDYEKLSKEISINLELNSDYVVKFFESWIETNYNLEMFDTQNAIEDGTSEAKLFDPHKPFLLHIRMELCSLTLRDVINKIKDCLFIENPKVMIGYYIASQILIEILESVNYLHEHDPQLIHRDLYPSNILLTNFVNNHCIKIADFGLSTFYIPEKQLTKSVGARSYRAPEIKKGNYTTKADMYSLGIIAKELFNFDKIRTATEANEKLESKLNNLTNMINNLLDDENNRPTCKEALDNHYLWSFDFNDVQNDRSFKEIIQNSSKEQSIDGNFIEYFILNKPTVKEDRFNSLKYANNFIEICSLGSGGFSTVFKSQNRKTKKIYAIKKISTDPEDIDICFKEIMFLSQLKSDYVVKYYDSWVEQNYYIGSFSTSATESISSSSLLYSPYKSLLIHLQMELCPMTLREVINIILRECIDNNANTLSLIGYYIASEILYEILECVQFLHSHNPAIIHRDLKPENILLTNFVNNRFIRLCDFGLSTFHEFAEQSHTKNTGTKKYRAFEVTTTAKYTTKADMYSLGIIVKELFHIDINSLNYSSLPILKSNINYLLSLTERLLSFVPSKRPNCEDLLSESNMWRLNGKMNLSDQQFLHIICNTNDFDSIESNFVSVFVKTKYEFN